MNAPTQQKAMSTGYWFGLALLPMLTSQLARLPQHNPTTWIACDYGGRLGALLVLALVPAARGVAFRFEKRAVNWWEVAIWILGLLVADQIAGKWLRHLGVAMFPATVIGRYPALHGWPYAFDLVAGLMLVAFSEEILFRRCAFAACRELLGEGYATIVATSVLFAAYHWWTGIGNIAAALLFGLIAGLFYRRSRAIWPLVVSHYLNDILNFA